jgi:putative transposase
MSISRSTPQAAESLARAIGETHRQYTGFVNARACWTGHLFQGRFSSVTLDDEHLEAAARYVALNLVRARLVERAEGLAVVERACASCAARRCPFGWPR